MALQRTRRPRLRSGRSLRSLGSPLNARPLGRIRAALLVLAALVAGPDTCVAEAASLTVPLRRPDPQEPKNVWVVLTKYSDGSDGCCAQPTEEVVHFEPGVSRADVIFENLEPCPHPKYWCKYDLKWWGYTTMFGRRELVLDQVGSHRTDEIVVEEGTVLSGKVKVDGERPYHNAYVKLFHASLPDGSVQVQVGKDGSFSFVGVPAAGQTRWEFSSLQPGIMKVAGVLERGATELNVAARSAQEISGCLRVNGRPASGASVQLYYSAWIEGSIYVGSGQAAANGCFHVIRDREAPAELKVYFGPTGWFRVPLRFGMPLPNIASGLSVAPLQLGIINLRVTPE